MMGPQLELLLVSVRALQQRLGDSSSQGLRQAKPNHRVPLRRGNPQLWPGVVAGFVLGELLLKVRWDSQELARQPGVQGPSAEEEESHHRTFSRSIVVDCRDGKKKGDLALYRGRRVLIARKKPGDRGSGFKNEGSVMLWPR